MAKTEKIEKAKVVDGIRSGKVAKGSKSDYVDLAAIAEKEHMDNLAKEAKLKEAKLKK